MKKQTNNVLDKQADCLTNKLTGWRTQKLTDKTRKTDKQPNWLSLWRRAFARDVSRRFVYIECTPTFYISNWQTGIQTNSKQTNKWTDRQTDKQKIRLSHKPVFPALESNQIALSNKVVLKYADEIDRIAAEK